MDRDTVVAHLGVAFIVLESLLIREYMAHGMSKDEAKALIKDQLLNIGELPEVQSAGRELIEALLGEQQ